MDCPNFCTRTITKEVMDNYSLSLNSPNPHWNVKFSQFLEDRQELILSETNSKLLRVSANLVLRFLVVGLGYSRNRPIKNSSRVGWTEMIGVTWQQDSPNFPWYESLAQAEAVSTLRTPDMSSNISLRQSRTVVGDEFKYWLVWSRIVTSLPCRWILSSMNHHGTILLRRSHQSTTSFQIVKETERRPCW